MDRKEKKGFSLATGPTALIGFALLVYGILGFLVSTGFTTSGAVPEGAVAGEVWLAPEVNGWTNLLHVATGGLLLVGALRHWAAKTLALIAGLVFGAASVTALIDQESVFGILPVNGWNMLVWGALAIALLLIALLPRAGGRDPEPEPTDRAIDARRPTVGDERIDVRDEKLGSRRPEPARRR